MAWMENNANDDFHTNTMRAWIAQIGLDLFKGMQSLEKLDSVSALRLWLYIYTEHAWAEFLNRDEFKGMAQDYLNHHKVYFLIPNAGISEKERPVWAVRAQKDFSSFFIEQGEWSEEVLKKARMLPGRRLAVRER